jgi:hypothetical protein
LRLPGLKKPPSCLLHLLGGGEVLAPGDDAAVGPVDVVVARVVDGLVVVRELLRAVEAAAVQLKSGDPCYKIPLLGFICFSQSVEC